MEPEKAVAISTLPNGCTLYRKLNEAGGYTYYSDEIGGEVVVWDTCLVNESTLISALAEEHRRSYAEHMENRKNGRDERYKALWVLTDKDHREIYELAMKRSDELVKKAMESKNDTDI